jgi:short-subunit dehydrogenase involved in D-alanine esterification of teichoic acids
MSLDWPFVQLSKVPVYCATKRFPFIYNFNETLAKRKKIEVIEMIPSTKH